MSTDYPKLKVYYDGLCRLCSFEIHHYRGMKGAENIHFVDITDPTFDPAKENLDPFLIHKKMHVRDRHGELHIGVNAFICIWQELPALQSLVPLARFRPIHSLLVGVYSVFARIRPWLPRKSCESSPYCEVHQR